MKNLDHFADGRGERRGVSPPVALLPAGSRRAARHARSPNAITLRERRRQQLRQVFSCLAAGPGRGEALAPALRHFFQDRLGADLGGVRIHRDAEAESLNRCLGTLAFARGDDVYFRPAFFAPRTGWGLWLLAHELAHVLQQRGGVADKGFSSHEGDNEFLEREAVAAATAVLRGRRVRIPPRPGCPPLQPVVPLLLLLAVAVGVALWPADIAPDPKPTGAPPPPPLYETGWGFVPVVGSLDQMINGKNWWTQMVGGVFFVLDVSVIGGLAVRGVMFSLTAARQAALRAAAKAAPEAIERLSYETLVRQGKAVFMGEEAAQELLKKLGSQGSTALVVGAQSGKHGAYHSVIYVIKDGQVYRLHGGLFRLAAGGNAMTVERALAQGWNRSFNSFTVYSARDLAARGITDEALGRLVTGWRNRFPGMLGAVENVCAARGCGNSQWLLMQQLGLPTNVSGLGRYLPLMLESSRMSGELGSHYVINTAGAYGGTALQTFLVGGLGASARFAYPLTNVLARDQVADPRADLVRAQLPPGLLALQDQLDQQENSLLMLPSEDVEFDPEELAFPGDGQIIVDLPNAPLVEQSGSINTGFRLPEGGGAKRNPTASGK